VIRIAINERKRNILLSNICFLKEEKNGIKSALLKYTKKAAPRLKNIRENRSTGKNKDQVLSNVPVRQRPIKKKSKPL
jgi:hypothetical protein